jgi:uncharacterized protein YbjT (DUF2867 family)
MEGRHIVVVGATGKQGLSTVRALLSRGFSIRALVRNPAKADSLRQVSNVEIFKGDLKDENSLKKLFDDAHGLFFVLPYTKNSIEYGKRLLGLAGKADLQHVVYSSVGGADRYNGVDHYRYKKEIETYLRALGKPYSILRPVGYMDELANPKSIRAVAGMMKLYLPPSKRFQVIALRDIGEFAGMAFDQPSRYVGREIEIAGDEMTLPDLFQKIENIKGVRIQPMRVPRFFTLFLPRVAKQMMTFYAEDGWQADIDELRKEHPALLTFEQWLATTQFYEDRHIHDQ